MTTTHTQENTSGKTFTGVVVKTAMKDTVTVAVESFVQHPKYKKFQRRTRKFLVHDAGNTTAVGDSVIIKETRPISRRKNFVVVSKTAAQKIEA